MSKEDTWVKFYDRLVSSCKQCLIDIDTPEFLRYVLHFMEREPDYLGDTMEIAKAMVKEVMLYED